jgi:hypothetical protein
MGISSKRVVLDDKTMEIISLEEYQKLLRLNTPIFDDTCVEDGKYFYPISKQYRPDTVSVTSIGPVIKFTDPVTEEDKKKYCMDNVIDFSSGRLDGMKDYMDKVDRLKNMESNRLTNIKNVLTIPINENDAPELKALKECINEKHIDAEAYKQKFPSASDYNNDLRHMKSDNNAISFFKAKRIAKAFDIEMKLIIYDKEDAVNPSGKVYNVLLTEGEN